MKNKEQFEKTVQVLVKAYFEGTLEHMDCRACAVGNIVGHGEWMPQFVRYDPYNERVQNNSGYTWKELGVIERAFESVITTREDFNSDQHQYNGLMAVLDVLFEIHEVEQGHEEYRKMFDKVEI